MTKYKFDTAINEAFERYQSEGFLVGDRVRFRKNCLNHPCLKDKGESLLKVIMACMEPGFDLNLRIGALKSIWPTTTQNYTAGTEAPTDLFADVYIEYAPGLYRNPMTVSIDCLELQDDGNNRGPVPDSLRRKNVVHGPKATETKVERDGKSDKISNAQSDTKLPNSNKWDDSKPGAGNFDTSVYLNGR